MKSDTAVNFHFSRFGGASYTKSGGRFGACPAELLLNGINSAPVDMQHKPKMALPLSDRKRWKLRQLISISRYTYQLLFYPLCIQAVYTFSMLADV